MKVVGEDHIFLPQEAETCKQVSQTSGLSYDSLVCLFYFLKNELKKLMQAQSSSWCFVYNLHFSVYVSHFSQLLFIKFSRLCLDLKKKKKRKMFIELHISCTII